MKKIIKIISWEIRIDDSQESGKQAELIGSDKQENEYRLEYNIYVLGERYDIIPNIICTEIK